MVLVIISCLFVFLGMYIANRWNLKYVSINFLFGVFLLNCLVQILPNGYNLLSYNYHDTTFIYAFLGVIIGIVLMMLFDYKSDNCDDVSIVGFTMINSYLLYSTLSSHFNFILFFVNILYYVSIGIYIKDGKSWVSVFLGMILGFFISLISSWWIGYFFSIVVGIILCFIYSISIVVIRNKGRYSYISLILGMVIGFLGSIL